MQLTHRSPILWAVFLQALCLVVYGGCGAPSPTYPAQSTEASAFVGSAVCGSCHPRAYASWERSDHRRAMEVALDSTVLGGFNGETFTHFEDTYQFIRSDSAFVVVANEDSFEVAYTFGYDPLQQVLLPTHKGRLQALTVAWDAQKRTWYSLYPDEPTPPGDALHWKSSNLNWNYMCADCHSTGLKRGFDVQSDTYKTTWEEQSVGCEACHGPGSDHIDWTASQTGIDPFKMESKTDVVKGVGRASTQELHREINLCASCHSRRVMLDDGMMDGNIPPRRIDFLDRYAPSLLEDSLYFGDGQMRDEVYVYGSFLQSKMAQHGVTCSDCHNVHSGNIKLPGNALCASCHAPTTYDSSVHSGHPQDASIHCVSCHMPERTYMGIDTRRDHRFGVPEPLLSAALGSPDVCGSCHPAQSARWADAQIEGWVAEAQKSRTPLNSYGWAVAALRARENRNSESGNQKLHQIETALTDGSVSEIEKASLLARLGGDPRPEHVRLVLTHLASGSDFEKVGALRALTNWADVLPAPDVSALLTDSSKWVRMEAVTTSLTFGRTDWSAVAAQRTLTEFGAAQRVNDDQPEAHSTLGRMYERLGNISEAESAFKTAVRLDSASAVTWLEWALFVSRRAAAVKQTDPATYRSQRITAETSFRKAALLESPIQSDVVYMFGLFLADDPARLSDAAAWLSEASRLDPHHPRKAYNAGLAHQQLNRAELAESFLKQAIANGSVDAREALVILYIQNARWDEAEIENDRILKAFPDHTSALERRSFIDSKQ